MIGLAQRQQEMMAALLDDEREPFSGGRQAHALGMDIYRNNYRSALVEALRATYERTERLVGQDSFARAAAHHLISSPPSGWTLDLAGEGFADTCADLFRNDPEVSELAALEWAMHTAFVARNVQPLTSQQFLEAASGFGDQDWMELRLRFVPGVALLTSSHDLNRLWSSLASDAGEADIASLAEPVTTIVWRENERPVFVSVPALEGRALASMIDGATYGEVCEALVAEAGPEGIEMAGSMLQRWLTEGLVEAIA